MRVTHVDVKSIASLRSLSNYTVYLLKRTVETQSDYVIFVYLSSHSVCTQYTGPYSIYSRWYKVVVVTIEWVYSNGGNPKQCGEYIGLWLVRRWIKRRRLDFLEHVSYSGLRNWHLVLLKFSMDKWVLPLYKVFKVLKIVKNLPLEPELPTDFPG